MAYSLDGVIQGIKSSVTIVTDYLWSVRITIANHNDSSVGLASACSLFAIRFKFRHEECFY